jgi:hypothetical protein
MFEILVTFDVQIDTLFLEYRSDYNVRFVQLVFPAQYLYTIKCSHK